MHLHDHADVPGRALVRELAPELLNHLRPRRGDRLCLEPWPGNVRELELLARKLLALHGDKPELRR